jgi:hypothetical protein
MHTDNPACEFTYPRSPETWDGALAALPGKLALTIDFDQVTLDELPRSKRATLWFRAGAKKVFHVRLVRKTGSCLIRIAGLDPAATLVAIKICRDHFDELFGVTPEDIRGFDA